MLLSLAGSAYKAGPWLLSGDLTSGMFPTLFACLGHWVLLDQLPRLYGNNMIYGEHPLSFGVWNLGSRGWVHRHSAPTWAAPRKHPELGVISMVPWAETLHYTSVIAFYCWREKHIPCSPSWKNQSWKVVLDLSTPMSFFLLIINHVHRSLWVLCLTFSKSPNMWEVMGPWEQQLRGLSLILSFRKQRNKTISHII